MKNIELKNKIFTLFKIFWICTCIGAQMFGSGMAVVPILKREFIEKRKWITEEELLDILSISKCSPGVYTVNVVTFVGNKISGFTGGAVAAIGITIAPIAIIIIFTILYKNICEIEMVKNALLGITICVCALITNSLIDLWKKAIISKFTLILFIIAFLIYVLTDVSIVMIVLSMGLSNFIYEKEILPRVQNRKKNL